MFVPEKTMQYGKIQEHEGVPILLNFGVVSAFDEIFMQTEFQKSDPPHSVFMPP